MNFDTKDNNIILISYPPGGFGNFLYHVLTEFASDTVKISNNANFSFDKTGHSHSTIKYTCAYLHNSDYYNATLTQDVDVSNKRILILADHGDNNTDHNYVKTKSFFPNAQILRVCVDQNTRHIVRRAIIEKGAGKNYEEENLKHAEQHWGKTLTDADLRENYTLMFHHHANDNIVQDLNQWHEVKCQNVINLCLADLIRDPVKCIINLIEQLEMEVINSAKLKELCNQWQNKNKKYFSSFKHWAQIQDSLNNNTNVSLSHVTSIYDQAYINYRLECLYNIVIPVYDYRHWFGDVFAINHMIDKLTTKINVG